MSGFSNDVLNASGFRLEEAINQQQSWNIMQRNSAVSFINGTGNPEGVVNANPASTFYAFDTGLIYRKASGTSTTGWVLSQDLYTAQYIVDGTDPNGSNFTTIQDAIDQAVADGVTVSAPGALICVRPGTYAPFDTTTAANISIVSLGGQGDSNISLPVIVTGSVNINSRVMLKGLNFSGTVTTNSSVPSANINQCYMNAFTVTAGLGIVVANCAIATSTTNVPCEFWHSSITSLTLAAGQISTFFSQIPGITYSGGSIVSTMCALSNGSLSQVGAVGAYQTQGSTNRVLSVANGNSSNLTASVQVQVGGASASDAFVQYTVLGVTNWVEGVDNSDSDAYVLSRGTSLGTTTALKFDTSGNLYLPGQTGIIGANGASAATASPVTNHATLVGAASNGITSLALGNSGQVLTSNGAGADPSYQSPAFVNETWTEVTGTSQAAAVNNGYIANNAGLVTITLPATAAIGQFVHILGKGTGLWALAANTGQTIKYGAQTTSTAGSLTATSRYHAVKVRCITANTDWEVDGTNQGNLTVA